jgi:maltose alpha-D-glucosyltransferase / alpha-amylase
LNSDKKVLALELSVRDREDWKSIFAGEWLKYLEENLPPFIARQRWFGGKSRHIRSTSVIDWGVFEAGKSALALVRLTYQDGDPDIYLLPLAMAFGDVSTQLAGESPGAIVAPLTSPQEMGVLHDGLFHEDSLLALLALIAKDGSITMQHGVARGLPSSLLGALGGNATELRPRRSSAEQSNSSIFFGDKLIMKVFRRQQPGINPDVEIGRYLTEHTSFRNIAPFGGSIEYLANEPSQAPTYIFAMLQGLVANEGDGWQWTLNELDRYYERSSREVSEAPEIVGPGLALPDNVRQSVGACLDAAETLGRRTGELHVALGQATSDENFNPIAFTTADAEALKEQILANAAHAFDALQGGLASLPNETRVLAKLALLRREGIFDRLGGLTAKEIGGLRTRVHGDYHLGQVLRTESDFVILDFEGEPARSLTERRAKQSPLKDVAGMLRSFGYAAFASLTRFTDGRPADAEKLEPWGRLWERAVCDEFLKAYRNAVGESPIIPSQPSVFQALLETYILDKALYELIYELNNRPTWVRIPLHGILSLTPAA